LEAIKGEPEIFPEAYMQRLVRAITKQGVRLLRESNQRSNELARRALNAWGKALRDVDDDLFEWSGVESEFGGMRDYVDSDDDDDGDTEEGEEEDAEEEEGGNFKDDATDEDKDDDDDDDGWETDGSDISSKADPAVEESSDSDSDNDESNGAPPVVVVIKKENSDTNIPANTDEPDESHDANPSSDWETEEDIRDICVDHHLLDESNPAIPNSFPENGKNWKQDLRRIVEEFSSHIDGRGVVTNKVGLWEFVSLAHEKKQKKSHRKVSHEGLPGLWHEDLNPDDWSGKNHNGEAIYFKSAMEQETGHYKDPVPGTLESVFKTAWEGLRFIVG